MKRLRKNKTPYIAMDRAFESLEEILKTKLQMADLCVIRITDEEGDSMLEDTYEANNLLYEIYRWIRERKNN